MPTFILIIISLLAVLALIRLLHARQVGESRKFAEQSSPLPPLREGEDAQDALPAASSPPLENIHVAAEVSAQSSSLPWQDEVKALRDTGRFQEALSLCRRQYPKMLAFRQTLITLRAKLRQHSDPSEELLGSLYQTAMLGDLCREKKAGDLDSREINRQLAQLQAPRQYWQQVGYRQLRMLTKTDRRMLVEHWGEPANHASISDIIQQQE